MKKTTALILALIIALTVLLAGCGEKAETVGEFVLAATPSPELLAEAEALLADFVTCYEENDAASAVELFTSDAEASEETLSDYFKTVEEYSDAPYVPGEIYYITNFPDTGENVKVKKTAEDENYIEFAPFSDDFFYAYYISDADIESRMLTFFLAKEDGKLKIQHTNPAVYKFGGKDANAYYEETKRLHDEGKLVAAYIKSCILGTIFRPGGHYRYANDVEMEDLCYELVMKITEELKLPLELEGTANSSVGQIDYTLDEEVGAIPSIIFKTDVAISDKAAIEAEAQKVIDALEKLSPGIRESFTHAKMYATNDEFGESASSITTEEFTIALK